MILYIQTHVNVSSLNCAVPMSTTTKTPRCGACACSCSFVITPKQQKRQNGRNSQSQITIMPNRQMSLYRLLQFVSSFWPKWNSLIKNADGRVHWIVDLVLFIHYCARLLRLLFIITPEFRAIGYVCQLVVQIKVFRWFFSSHHIDGIVGILHSYVCDVCIFC